MIRVIARVDIRNEHAIKGVQMEGVRVVGDAATLAKKYAEHADELLLVDAVASLYGRPPLFGLMDKITDGCFVPITVCGGLRSVADMRAALNAGADKCGVNTAAHARPALIREAADVFGSQAVVLQIDAKRTAHGYECYVDSGREPTGVNVVTWAQRGQALGAGEILLTSIDRDGTRGGFDLALLNAVAGAVDIPVVISGGGMECSEAAKVADGLAFGSALHSGMTTIADIKRRLHEGGVRVRPCWRSADERPIEPFGGCNR